MTEPDRIPVSDNHYLVENSARYLIRHDLAGNAGYVWQEPDGSWTASNVYGEAEGVAGLVRVTEHQDPMEAARAYLIKRDT